jgi:chromosomal replication initiation ATPase DnaA
MKKKIAAILKLVSIHYNCSVEELYHPSRIRKFVHARYTAMYFIRKYVKCSYNQIADIFYNDERTLYHHTTVMHGIKTIKNFIDVKQSPVYEAVVSVEDEISELPVFNPSPKIIIHYPKRMKPSTIVNLLEKKFKNLTYELV